MTDRRPAERADNGPNHGRRRVRDAPALRGSARVPDPLVPLVQRLDGHAFLPEPPFPFPFTARFGPTSPPRIRPAAVSWIHLFASRHGTVRFDFTLVTAPRRYIVHTFGCRVNQADSAGLAAALDAHAFDRTTSVRHADVVILNTCTVTHRSDADVRKAVRRVRRENPAARVVVTGCSAQRDPEALRALPGVSAVLGHAHRARLPVVTDAVLRAPPDPARPVVLHSALAGLDPRALPAVEPVTTALDRTRPFIKIQDGCDAHCTYCIIPDVRGRARSAPPAQVTSAVRRLVAAGHVEIVLAGVHLGTYGQREGSSLTQLVRGLLADPDLVRLRLSCIEPMAFDVDLASIAAADPRLCPHFHLPLQSGADPVLKRMVRPYRAHDFARLVDGIRSRLPDACIGTDVIVGFPGETDDDFRRTCRFVEEAGIDHVHVFSYSDREGTPSTRLSPKVDPRVVRSRSQQLHEVADRRWDRFLARHIETVRPAVTLHDARATDGWVRALTDTFVPLWFHAPGVKPNRDVRVRLTEVENRTMRGVLARAENAATASPS